MGARSLRQMAQKVCIQHVSAIEDVGDAEYDIIRPLLLVCSPHQLDKFEQQSPQLIGRDAEIWRAFIRRDIELWKTQFHEPEDPRHFAKIYRKLASAQRTRMRDDEARLLTKMQSLKSAQQAYTTKKVELDIVKPPPGVTAEAEVIRASPAIRRALQVRRRVAKADTADKSKPSSKLAGFRKQAAAMSRFAKPAHGQVMTRPNAHKATGLPSQKNSANHQEVAVLPSQRPLPAISHPRKRPAAQLEPHSGNDESEREVKKARIGGDSKPETTTSSTPSLEAPNTGSTRTKQSSLGSQLKPGNLSDHESKPAREKTPQQGFSTSPIQRSTTSKPGAASKPLMLKKKRPVNIFMPAKNARVH